MEPVLDPILYKELAEAKAALARHGIVIIRSVETDLEPAMLSAAKDAIASSPAALREMEEEDLDRLMESLRKSAMKASRDLAKLYTRLLAQIGTESVVDLVKELDGIRKLFSWERIAKAAQPLDRKLGKAGFGEMRLGGSADVSEAFRVEFEERWPAAFSRFSDLARAAAKELGADGPGEAGKGAGSAKKG